MIELTREKTGKNPDDTRPIENVLSDLLEKGTRREILIQLMGGGDKGISFRGLGEACSLKPTSLAYHLKVLESRGGISKEFRYQEEGREFSFYHLSELGRAAVDASRGLFDIGEEIAIARTDKVVIVQATSAPRILFIRSH